MSLHHLVGGITGSWNSLFHFHKQEKKLTSWNKTSFIWDKCCHLTLCLRLMEPHWLGFLEQVLLFSSSNLTYLSNSFFIWRIGTFSNEVSMPRGCFLVSRFIEISLEAVNYFLSLWDNFHSQQTLYYQIRTWSSKDFKWRPFVSFHCGHSQIFPGGIVRHFSYF